MKQANKFKQAIFTVIIPSFLTPRMHALLINYMFTILPPYYKKYPSTPCIIYTSVTSGVYFTAFCFSLAGATQYYSVAALGVVSLQQQ
jgi:hypothetical protein